MMDKIRGAAAPLMIWISLACQHIGHVGQVAACWLGRTLLWLAEQAGRAARRVWAVCSPTLVDWGGWLRYSLPRLAAAWLRRALPRLGRWLLHTGWLVIRYAFAGLWWLLALTARYVLAYNDFADLIIEARALGKPRRARMYRAQWRRAALHRTIGILAVILVLWITLAALAHYGWSARLAEIGVVTAILAGIGRATRRRPGTDIGTGEEPADDPNAPFPLADAHTRAEVADCVRRAVTSENMTLRMVGEPARFPWGWSVPIVLKTGKPADLITRLGDLETVLDVPAGGVLATPDQTRRARVMLRLIQRDPFDVLAPLAEHPPGSLSILDQQVIGARMDGKPLTVRLAGAQVAVIGTSGAGKSTALRVLADIVTACRDAICWDLAAVGTGLDVFGAAIGRRERDHAGIEDALAEAIAYATVRPHIAADLGMTGEWEPSPGGPALVVMIDEYPALTAKAKQLVAQLWMLGRKARISLVLAANEATSDTLGRAIADTGAVRIMLPSRHSDVRLVFGPQMIADGWRPDRLHPAIDDTTPEDAGRLYISAPSIREPVLCKIVPLPLHQAEQHGYSRATAGIPVVDRATVEQARRHRAAATKDATDDDQVEIDHDAIAAILAAFGTDTRLWTEELLARLAASDDRYQEWTPVELAEVLRPLNVGPSQIRRAGRNRNGYYRHHITDALEAYRISTNGKEMYGH